MTRAPRRATAALPQKGFDPGVFERMKRDDREAAARHQQPLGRGEAPVELAELVIDRDPQGLKGAGRRIEPGLTPRDCAAHDVRELAGAADRGTTARRDDCSCDAPCVAFLAEIANQFGEVALLEPGNQIGGARPILSHAHIERTVETEREAALGGVELGR